MKHQTVHYLLYGNWPALMLGGGFTLAGIVIAVMACAPTLALLGRFDYLLYFVPGVIVGGLLGFLSTGILGMIPWVIIESLRRWIRNRINAREAQG